MSGWQDIANGSVYDASMAGFFSKSESATRDNSARKDLVSRSRILYLESPIARACIDVLLRECVGSGLRYKPKDSSEYFSNYTAITNALSDKLKKRSDLHLIESTHRLTWAQVQALVFRTILLSGDCFIIIKDDGEIIIKESDYVFTPPFLNYVSDGVAKYNSNLVIDGIELGESGNPIAYWFCNNLYGEDTRDRWERVSAYKDNGEIQVLHCAYMERPSQYRGIPLLAPVIEDLWSLRAYLTSETQMAIMQANMSLIITTNTNPTVSPFVALSKMDLDAPLVPSKPQDREQSEDFSIAPPPSGNMVLNGLIAKTNFVRSGSSIHLAEGEDIKMISPTAPHSGLETFIRCVVEQIGSAIGIPSQILMARIDSNYASCKAAFAELQHTVRLYRGMFIETFLKPYFRAFASNTISEEGWQSDTYSNAECALLLSTESVWQSTQNQTILEPNREIDFYTKAIELGLVSRDEVAQILFGHDAVNNNGLAGGENGRNSTL